MKDYYQILNLQRKATPEEIKKAYRLFASKFHPDKHQGDKFFEEKFKEVLEAYEILSNPEKREKYDIRCGVKRDRYQREDYDQSKEEMSSDYNWQEPKSQENKTHSKSSQSAKNTSNSNNETPVKNFGKHVFWGGILGSFLFLLGGLDTIIIFATVLNIGFWGGGLIWLIGSKLNI